MKIVALLILVVASACTAAATEPNPEGLLVAAVSGPPLPGTVPESVCIELTGNPECRLEQDIISCRVGGGGGRCCTWGACCYWVGDRYMGCVTWNEDAEPLANIPTEPEPITLEPTLSDDPIPVSAAAELQAYIDETPQVPDGNDLLCTRTWGGRGGACCMMWDFPPFCCVWMDGDMVCL